MKILVTGASGFVGRAVCPALYQRGFSVCAISRQPVQFHTDISFTPVPSLSSLSPSTHVFDDVECVIHLAGRAHVMRETVADPLLAFRTANVFDTLNFARSASQAGVKRFIFLSSIKVNGDKTHPDSPFSEKDTVSPACPYSLSKYEAELGLLDLSASTGMEVVIVRPPLIYGPFVKGNFSSLMKLISLQLPLPFRQLSRNKRSYLAIYNLIDFLALCCSHPAAAGRTFLVGDQHDVSTSELLLRLGDAMSLSVHLFPVPVKLLEVLAISLRQQHVLERLCGSLILDCSLANQLLGWAPPVTLDDGLRRACQHFSL